MIRTAIVGMGFIGMAHLEALRRIPHIEIAALCDARTDLQKLCVNYGIPRAFSDYRQMMDEMELEAVHICTPNHTHYEIAKYALEHGIHVLCEKPFTMTVQQAEELTELALQKGLKGTVNFHNRCWPMTVQMHSMAAGGKLGKIITIHGSYLQDWLLFPTDFSWRLQSKAVGKMRAVGDIGSHWLDLAEFTSCQKIRRVFSRLSTVYPTRYRAESADELAIDTEDCAAILLEFENGAIGSLNVSQMFAGAKNKLSLCIGGCRQSLQWDSERSNDLLIGHRDVPNESLTKDPSLLFPEASSISSYPGGHVEGFPDAFKQCFIQFYSSIMGDGKDCCIADFQDGLHSMRVCEAIWNSSQSERWVEINNR